jgi:hypothetical protein
MFPFSWATIKRQTHPPFGWLTKTGIITDFGGDDFLFYKNPSFSSKKAPPKAVIALVKCIHFCTFA